MPVKQRDTHRRNRYAPRGSSFNRLGVSTQLSAVELRKLAAVEKDRRVAMRLVTVAESLDGMKREDAASIASVLPETVQDWIARFNARGVAGLRRKPVDGRPRKLSRASIAELKAIIARPPDPLIDGAEHWTATALCRVVEAKFGARYGESGMRRLLRSLGCTSSATGWTLGSDKPCAA